jgi:isoleucyl-tRNA synthetase
MGGKRSHGYGIDVLRLWASKNDSDADFELDQAQLEEANRELK